MTPVEWVNLSVGVVTLLGMFGGLAKFFFSMQKALELHQLETKGHIAGLKKDIDHLTSNGIKTIQANQSLCMKERKEREKELFELQRNISERIVVLETKAAK